MRVFVYEDPEYLVKVKVELPEELFIQMRKFSQDNPNKRMQENVRELVMYTIQQAE